MKRIIDECRFKIISTGPFAHETIKLRLRGKGSGFLEGQE